MVRTDDATYSATTARFIIELYIHELYGCDDTTRRDEGEGWTTICGKKAKFEVTRSTTNAELKPDSAKAACFPSALPFSKSGIVGRHCDECQRRSLEHFSKKARAMLNLCSFLLPYSFVLQRRALVTGRCNRQDCTLNSVASLAHDWPQKRRSRKEASGSCIICHGNEYSDRAQR